MNLPDGHMCFKDAGTRARKRQCREKEPLRRADAATISSFDATASQHPLNPCVHSAQNDSIHDVTQGSTGSSP